MGQSSFATADIQRSFGYELLYNRKLSASYVVCTVERNLP